MAYSPLSSLLRRSSPSPILRHTPRRLILARRTSTSAAAASPGDSPKSTLSARMSFVFDQIDAIERERNEKDETLRRIRAWREKHRAGADQSAAAPAAAQAPSPEKVLGSKEVELVHPWPEWVEFMELLMRQNYFDHRRRDESRSIPNLVDGGDDDLPVFVEEGIDFTRDFSTVRTACVNFGRDRFDILRPLSRKDIQVLVGYGCPSTDPKLIYSAKVLRKYVHLDEGDVCSACSMRNACNKAYLLTRKENEARTVDVIRLLVTYGFDPINGSVENKSLMTNKSIKIVIRKLLYEMSKLGSVPIDPNLPPPIIKKPPPKIKQPPPPLKKRVGRDDIEMKKGDWLCPKCDFMNFAKNTICLQCDAKRPKRQLLPGEWECPECNFLNYRRNMVCFHCEHKRPPDEYMENKVQENQSHPGTRLQRLARNPVISDAWNFDFDDNESDGADVAAFEFADPPKAAGLYSMDNQTHENGKMQEFQGEDMFVNNQAQGVGEERQYSEPHKRWGPPSVANGTGFDDFDDEDDDHDDVDSYKIDSPDNQSKRESTWSSGSHDFHDDGNSPQLPQRRMPLSDSRYSDSDIDSEGENSDYSNWKSSHIANGKHKSKSENSGHMDLSFGSDDELGFSSDGDDRHKSSLGEFSEKRDNRRRLSPVRNPRNKHSETEDEVLFGSDSEGEDDHQDHKNRRNKLRDVSSFVGDCTSAVRNGGFRLNGIGETHNSYGDRNNRGRNSARSHWNEGYYGEKRHRGRRANERNDDFRGSDRFGRGGRFGRKQRDDFDEFSARNRIDRERDFGRDRPRRDNFDELSDRNRMDRERDFGRDRPQRGNFDKFSGRNGMNRERDFGRDRPRHRIMER